ncbi:unnamed protein product, partial [Mesorhabditis belari]|uniref:Uncharacterized protein n=1 Tax=Mesorhabditis belari TaxID=2138241 RepID=A0AAF3EYH7_9BILA
MYRALLIVGILLVTAESISRHHHRRRSLPDDQSSEMMTKVISPSCELLCEAQWKSDFQIYYDKMYDSGYYDIPLDPAVISSKSDLVTFCRLTEQKYNCLKTQCKITDFPWTPERHICKLHADNFKASITCFKKTKDIVHDDCSSLCDRLTPRISPAEKRFIENRKLPRQAVKEFERQNSACLFVACHRLCHEKVIEHKCYPSERAKALETVAEYYDEYMRKEFEIFALPDHNLLFSSLCRRITPDEDEEEFVTGNASYNNRTMNRLINGVKIVIQTIENKEQDEE